MSDHDVIPPSPQHRDEEILQHVLREVRAGRGLDDVLGDQFVADRAEADAHARVLDHPEVAQAVGAEIVAEMKRLRAEAAAAGAAPTGDAGGQGASDELIAEMKRVQGEG